MPYSLVATADFLPGGGPTPISVEAGDVDSFFSAVKAALGVPAAIGVSMQYMDEDFDEWCDVDDLDDLAGDAVQVKLRAPAGVAVVLEGPNAAPAAATPAKAADASFDFGTSSAPSFTPPAAGGAAADLDAWAGGVAPPDGSSEFQLKIVESSTWVPEGQVCPVHCTDLDGLVQQLQDKIGLVGVTVELFDEDFEEWCGPASLDEVMPEATIRLKATGTCTPKTPPAPAPAPATPPPASTSAAFDYESERLRAEQEALEAEEQMLAQGKSEIHTSAL
eukprot:SAG22_NODE_6530_length_842_cov_1.643338_1_plen_276_part_10